MSAVRAGAIVFSLALAGLALSCSSQLRSRSKVALSSCGPELRVDTIMEIVRDAVRVGGGDPVALERDYELKIAAEGCDYVVTGIRRLEATTDHLVLRIGRSGEIKSWPWCCEPDYFVPPPRLPKASLASPGA
jgi:hypothetical protein